MTDPAPQNLHYPSTINALTSLRFFGALAVFIDHVLYYITRPPYDNFTLLLYKGHMGVDFFFVLSGFILAHVYYSQVLAGTFSVRKFLVNRIARIYPLHVATMAAVLVIALVRGHWGNDIGVHALVTNLLLVQDWGFDKEFSFNPPAWSISAEWFAYLLFPLLILLSARRLDPLSSLIVALGFFGAMWAVTTTVLQVPFTTLTLPFGTLRILPEFCFGMGLYIFGQAKPRLSGGPLSLSLCLAAITALFYMRAPDALPVLLLGLLIFLVAERSRCGKFGVLDQPAAVYLGEISYAIYMIHYIVLFGVWLLRDSPYFPWILAASFPATLAFAALLHHAVELPCRQWIRTFQASKKAA